LKFFGGQNLAIIYGFGLILLAIIMGFIYNYICTQMENEINKINRGTLKVYIGAAPGVGKTYTMLREANELKKKGIDTDILSRIGENGKRTEVSPVRNQFFVLRADQSSNKTQLGRFNGEKIVPLNYRKASPYGIRPRNAGQYFLQEALMESAQNAPLVIVKGMAGTAKTFYSLAVGLEKVMELNKKEYRKIIISRPNAQFDDEIGFLPGDEQEKIAPLIRPVIDNLELLIDQDDNQRYKDERELSGKIDELFDREIIVPQAMNFIRGRSITQTYMIIDEAQNLTPKQAKGIITRVGKGTKVILLGDPNQIDHPLLDERTNGLSYASEKMKDSPLCYQITLSASECERSDLAMDAIIRMN
ncbi:MAG: AAA family ATPase, partial [Clostridiales bacterium]|nr:AAA family ATPase [Clostridiales bacterium]